MSIFVDDKIKKRFSDITDMFDITSKKEIEFSPGQKKALGQLDSSQETMSMIEGSSDAWSMFALPMGKKKAMKKSSLGKGRQDELKIQLESDPNPNISSAIDARAGKGKRVGYRTGKGRGRIAKGAKTTGKWKMSKKEDIDDTLMRSKSLTPNAKPFVGKSVKYKKETDEQMMKRHRSGVDMTDDTWTEPEWHKETTEIEEEEIR